MLTKAKSSTALPATLLVLIPLLMGYLAFMFLPKEPVPPTPVPAGTCYLSVPAAPMTAKGLSTPYKLSGTGCTEQNPNTAAFVEATIINPATGQLSVYHPLVVNAGNTLPAAPPVTPTLASGDIVGLWFGSNGTYLVLKNAPASCVNGLPGSPFGQVSFCNTSAFYAAVNDAIASGLLKVPALGIAKDGKTCPSVRDFSIVDQDPSDNVTGTELVSPNGSLAQNTAANRKSFPTADLVRNGSDNALLTEAVDPALGCKPWTVPLLEDPGAFGPSQALDEVQAAMMQQAPIATVPVNDEMVQVNGKASLAKLNAYRAGVDQRPYLSLTEAEDMQTMYCQQLATTGAQRLYGDEKLTWAAPSFDPAVGSNLFTFLAARYLATWNLLKCGKTPPVQVTTNAQGVATQAVYAVR